MKFPSYLATSIFAIVLAPITINLSQHIQSTSNNTLMLILVIIFGLCIPFFFTVVEYKYLMSRTKSIFDLFDFVPVNKETIENFYLPTIKRLLLFFILTSISLFLISRFIIK